MNVPVRLMPTMRFHMSRECRFPSLSIVRQNGEIPAAATTPPNCAPVDCVQAIVPSTALLSSDSFETSVLKYLTRELFLEVRSPFSWISRTETKAPASRSVYTVASPRPDDLKYEGMSTVPLVNFESC